MPAVKMCDPMLPVALRQHLDTAGQSKSSDDLNIGLAGSASRILHTDIEYEETDNFRATVQDRLKSKYVVLTVPKQENTENGKVKDVPTCSKNVDKSKEPKLPEPAVTLYPADKVNLGWNKNFPIGAGMYNVGNTCYLNSTLQALFHVPALVNWLTSDSHHDAKCEQSDGGGECLTCAVAKTLSFSHQKSGDAIKPFSIFNKLKFICRTMVPGQQEDAHEFLRYLLEGMEKAYLTRHKATKLDSYSKETTPINQIFGGYIRTEVKCLQCRHISTTFQHFQDLLLDIRKSSTLDEALAGYFSQEQLDNNDYKCEACKRRVPATKQFILERPPKVLCVQLKRFSVLGGKISKHIGFKQTIDMGPYIRRQPGEPPSKVIYRLASMVTHMGPSVNCGHYTAIAQVSSGKFYSFDDSLVRQISLSNVVSTNAYIMIFEMEPSSALSNCQPHSSGKSVSTKSDVATTSKPSLTFPHSNGLSSKLLHNNSNGNKSSSPSSQNGSPSKAKDREESSGAPTPPPPPPPPPALTPPNNGRRSFIGPLLPPHMEKDRLSEMSKNSKLVDYDEESSDDEERNGKPANSLKSPRNERESFKPKSHSPSPSKSVKTNGNAYSSHNGNGYHSTTNGENPSNGVGSNSSSSRGSSSSRDSSPKNGSDKVEQTNGSSTDKDKKEKDKWTYSKGRSDSEPKIYTKASAGVNKGWHVCKDSPSPSSNAAVNGWSVSDHVSDSRDETSNSTSKSSNYSTTPNAAEMRSFNGTNRSDTVSQLQKSSQWAYGNSSVTSWNGGKARIDREVDTERRQERLKRSYDNEDDEIDRGRTKKIKPHRNDYKNRDSSYNRFQEYHNSNGMWRQNNIHRHKNNYHPYRHPHNGNNSYNRRPNHRYHPNKSRHWCR